MPTIAIYVEGGGDSASGRAQLRQGFDALLAPQKEAARLRRLGWKLVPCGGREAACDAFINAAQSAPEAITVLLVDAEEPVSGRTAASRVAHLTKRDRWDLSSVAPEQVHLMVQCMEAWIVADADALAKFYGQRFNRKTLPKRDNLEEEPKQALYDALERATKPTQKGAYGKIKHASQLLGQLEPALVAARCPQFSLFTKWLAQAIARA